jgi:PAS domain S-box-containing protein
MARMGSNAGLHASQDGGEELPPMMMHDRLMPQRRRADREHDLFGTIVEEAFSEIVVIDADTLAIILANRSARKNLGYTLAELMGMTIPEVKVEFSAAQLIEIYRPILAGETAKLVANTVHRRKDGTLYPVEVHSRTSVFDGRPVIFQIVIDQTEIRRGQVRAELASSIERDAAEARDSRALLAGLLARLGRQLGCPIAHAYVWNEAACRLELSDIWHLEAPTERQAQFNKTAEAVALAPEDGLAQQACRQRQSLILRDSGERSIPLQIPAWGGTAVCAGFAIPILIGSEVPVVLEFFSVRELAIEVWPELMQSLAEQISRLYARKCADESANESRERFDAAVNGADVGLWDYNYKSGLFYLSPRCREILNIPDMAPLPSWKKFGKNVHPKDVRRTAVAMNAHMLKRTPYDVEYRYRLANGEYIWLHSRARGVWDDKGNIVRTAGTIEDISRQKEGESVQREVLACIAASTDTTTKITAALDKVCHYLKLETATVSRVVNDCYEVRYRSSGGGGPALQSTISLADTICSDVYSGEVLQAFPDLARSPVATHPARSQMSVEAYIGITVFVKGVRFGTLSFYAPRPRKAFEHAEIAMVNLLGRWIGEEIGRASDVAELIENSLQISAKLACAADALLTVDQTGRIEDANPAAVKMFSWTLDELHQMSIGALLPTVKAFTRPGGGLVPVSLRQDIAVRKDGQRIAVLLNVSEIRLGKRNIYTVAISDLTAVKQAEVAKGEFVSIVSHELRTPLTSIRGALGLITSETTGPLSPETAKLADIAQRNCERLLRLVNDILAIEKLESGQFEMSLHPIDLNVLLRDAVAANTLYAAKFNVTFDLSLASDLPLVIADGGRLMQVMANLLSNAAKFTRTGTVVFVTGVVSGKYARISVRDQGNGIPDGIRERIFEKFIQGESANTRGREGSGLGLSITRQMVELMNGEVEFTSEAGIGTTFIVSLPIAELEGRADGGRKTIGAEKRERRPQRSPKKREAVL